jgi:mycofactocin precursor
MASSASIVGPTKTAPDLDEEDPMTYDEPTQAAAQTGTEELVTEDLVIEEVSIDGMCGVY